MATTAEWAERVARWVRSGLRAEKFARRGRSRPKQPHWWRWERRAEKATTSLTYSGVGGSRCVLLRLKSAICVSCEMGVVLAVRNPELPLHVEALEQELVVLVRGFQNEEARLVLRIRDDAHAPPVADRPLPRDGLLLLE
ncbi:uncharacterized protein SOCE836_079870 [Sorangium cellulosum]|uniref:Uncharacterized protein n=1 Tax=Sorangium cellulosum TaxID=56 RepID=A0A4P2QZP1_SORCE|nr:uncharacterized protein SOCE836_079870 [Sorangium cellulosum]